MANRVADGDLTARMDETAVGEIGTLERTFNTMAGSLERSRDHLARLLREQEGLRRVATLVAEGAEPTETFEAVSREIGLLCQADFVRMSRYEGEGMVTHVANWSRLEDEPPPDVATVLGKPVHLDPRTMAGVVFEKRAPTTSNGLGHIADEARALGVRSAVGCPITVEGRLWGAISAGARREAAFPADSLAQIGEFTELIGTAIANAVNRDELVASRARIVAAADEARRRIRRDLHDGAQQRLVHSVITLKLARRALDTGDPKAGALLDEGLENAEGATSALRDLSHGILPSVLTRGGLRAGVDSLVARISLPVDVEVEAKRFPPGAEATAYFVVSEGLTNVLKHSGATRAEVIAGESDGVLRVEVRDDGKGGAALGGGSGLVGLRDRVAAQGGSLQVESPPDGGTRIVMILPLPDSGSA
jgi:signal transduction histidine kinase